MGNFSEELQQVQTRINRFLEAQFEGIESHNAPLLDAMKYALLLGGKRVRPFFSLRNRSNAWRRETNLRLRRCRC